MCVIFLYNNTESSHIFLNTIKKTLAKAFQIEINNGKLKKPKFFVIFSLLLNLV